MRPHHDNENSAGSVTSHPAGFAFEGDRRIRLTVRMADQASPQVLGEIPPYEARHAEISPLAHVNEFVVDEVRQTNRVPGEHLRLYEDPPRERHPRDATSPHPAHPAWRRLDFDSIDVVEPGMFPHLLGVESARCQYA